ncbi:DMT family transporter [Oceaniovalibus sp. ACAM 378]|uniref:DMT family transporter n=1 Tax=Oceaniovalibus sp. ACAM 378 TaxID=2599923 RepID=UPI001CA37E2A|nr:DMT family transporter [Oceaniovalibus sp. ACAM 378]
MDVVFWRCVFAAGALVAYCYFTGAFRAKVTRRQLAIAVLGGVAIVLNWLLLFVSYRYASVSISTAIYNVQPFILLGFGVFLFDERFTFAKLSWLGLAFAGLLLILLEKPTADYVRGSYAWGVLFVLTAATGWAIAAATTKYLTGMPPQLIALIHVLTGVVILLPFADLVDLPSGGRAWTLLAIVGLVHTGFMYALMYSAVQRLPTHLQGTLTFINPVVAILTDVLALGHFLHWTQLLGIGIILISAAGTTVLPRLIVTRAAQSVAAAEGDRSNISNADRADR